MASEVNKLLRNTHSHAYLKLVYSQKDTDFVMTCLSLAVALTTGLAVVNNPRSDVKLNRQQLAHHTRSMQVGFDSMMHHTKAKQVKGSHPGAGLESSI